MGRYTLYEQNTTWTKQKETAGLIYDRSVSVQIKTNEYKTAFNKMKNVKKCVFLKILTY